MSEMNNAKLFTIKQLTEVYPALTEGVVRWKLRKREIPTIKISNRYYFRPNDIDSWLESHFVIPRDMKTKRANPMARNEK